MMNTKDLREIFEELRSEAGKRASDAMSDVTIGRRERSMGLVWFSIGLTVGAAIGVIAAFLSSPYSGGQARAKISEPGEKVPRPYRSPETNGPAPPRPAGSYHRNAYRHL